MGLAGVYNEEVWESLDFVLAEAAKRNLRLIIPIEVLPLSHTAGLLPGLLLQLVCAASKLPHLAGTADEASNCMVLMNRSKGGPCQVVCPAQTCCGDGSRAGVEYSTLHAEPRPVFAL